MRYGGCLGRGEYIWI